MAEEGKKINGVHGGGDMCITAWHGDRSYGMAVRKSKACVEDRFLGGIHCLPFGAYL